MGIASRSRHVLNSRSTPGPGVAGRLTEALTVSWECDHGEAATERLGTGEGLVSGHLCAAGSASPSAGGPTRGSLGGKDASKAPREPPLSGCQCLPITPSGHLEPNPPHAEATAGPLSRPPSSRPVLRLPTVPCRRHREFPVCFSETSHLSHDVTVDALVIYILLILYQTSDLFP